MPLEGQWARQNAPLRPTSRRERRLLALFLVLIVAGVAAVLYATLHGSAAKQSGCVSVTAATSTGGATLQQCGAAARAWCREQGPRTDAFAQQVQAACERARVPMR